MTDETKDDAGLKVHDTAAADERDTNEPDPETPETPEAEGEESEPAEKMPVRVELRNDVANALDKAIENGVTIEEVCGVMCSILFSALFGHNSGKLLQAHMAQMMMAASADKKGGQGAPQLIVPSQPQG